MRLQRTTRHIPAKQLSPKWHVVDAKGQRLGRLASHVARVLQGKHTPHFSPHQLTGDFVVVVNAAAVDVTGAKRQQKVYYRHTGYIGHLRQRSLDEMLERFPERVISYAVRGMLPGTRLGRRMLKRLKVYSGEEHPHEAQVKAGTGARAAARAARAAEAEAPSTPPRRRGRAKEGPQSEPVAEQPVDAVAEPEEEAPAPTPTRRRRATAESKAEPDKPARRTRASMPRRPRAPRKKEE